MKKYGHVILFAAVLSWGITLLSYTGVLAIPKDLGGGHWYGVVSDMTGTYLDKELNGIELNVPSGDIYTKISSTPTQSWVINMATGGTGTGGGVTLSDVAVSITSSLSATLPNYTPIGTFNAHTSATGTNVHGLGDMATQSVSTFANYVTYPSFTINMASAITSSLSSTLSIVSSQITASYNMAIVPNFVTFPKFTTNVASAITSSLSSTLSIVSSQITASYNMQIVPNFVTYPKFTTNVASAITSSLSATLSNYAASSHNQAESTITFSDITTGDTSTIDHGYFPKITGSAGQFFKLASDLTITYANISGGGDVLASNYGTDYSANYPLLRGNIMPSMVGKALQGLRANAGATDLEFAVISAATPTPTSSTLGGVMALDCGTGGFVQGINLWGTNTCASNATSADSAKALTSATADHCTHCHSERILVSSANQSTTWGSIWTEQPIYRYNATSAMTTVGKTSIRYTIRGTAWATNGGSGSQRVAARIGTSGQAALGGTIVGIGTIVTGAGARTVIPFNIDCIVQYDGAGAALLSCNQAGTAAATLIWTTVPVSPNAGISFELTNVSSGWTSVATGAMRFAIQQVIVELERESN